MNSTFTRSSASSTSVMVNLSSGDWLFNMDAPETDTEFGNPRGMRGSGGSASSGPSMYRPRNKNISRVPPLQRGSACVQCRSRKMRCSGTRPACAHCIRRREDCFYDGAKPSFKSEGLDPNGRNFLVPSDLPLNGAGACAGSSIGDECHGSTSQLVTAPTLQLPTPRSSHQSSLSVDTSSCAQLQNMIPTSNFPGELFPSVAQFHSAPAQFLSSLQSQAGSWMPAHEAVNITSLLGSNRTTSPFGGLSTDQLPQVAPSTFECQTRAGDPSYFSDPSHFSTGTHTVNFPVASDSPNSAPSIVPERDSLKRPGASESDATRLVKRSASWAETNCHLSAEQQRFDRSAVNSVREHFIARFFSPTSAYHGRNTISESRFRVRMILSDTSRPNKSLQHAICMLGAASMVPENKARTEKLYGLANGALENEWTTLKCPVDTITAAHLVATWLWREGRSFEGYLLNGRALQLAVVCGLHLIPSSMWVESSMFVEEATGTPTVLSPASDSIELNERIHILHAIIATDICANLVTRWPSMACSVSVTTPLPRNFPQSPSDLFDGEDVATPSLTGKLVPSLYRGEHTTLCSASILALQLLYRAIQLPSLPVEPPEAMSNDSPRHGLSLPSPESPASDSPLSSDAENPWSGSGWMRNPRYRTPRSFQALREALVLLQRGLSAELCDLSNWDVATLHIFIHTAHMSMFDIEGNSIDHEEAYRRASICVNLISGLTYNIFRPGIFGPFTALPWIMVFKVLYTKWQREKRLHHEPEAADALANARAIHTALKARALSCGLAAELARRANHLLSRTL